jgi:hypothetical protein
MFMEVLNLYSVLWKFQSMIRTDIMVCGNGVTFIESNVGFAAVAANKVTRHMGARKLFGVWSSPQAIYKAN